MLPKRTTRVAIGRDELLISSAMPDEQGIAAEAAADAGRIKEVVNND